MFCPLCKSEYREGFTRCADCDVDLVDAPGLSAAEEVNVNERPDLAPTKYYLAWFIPMVVYLVLFFGIWFRPAMVQIPFLMIPTILLTIVANVGSFWMIYQAIRFEKKVGRYVLLAFVPYTFIWYSLVRQPLHKPFPAKIE